MAHQEKILSPGHSERYNDFSISPLIDRRDTDQDEYGQPFVDKSDAAKEGATPFRWATDFANVLKSFIGSNFLALPYAFRMSGLFGGIAGIIIIALVTEHCCKLLVTVKVRLSEDLLSRGEKKQIKTYGDVGTAVWGKHGTTFVDSLLVFTQTGFCIGYLIFLATIIGSLIDCVYTDNNLPKMLTRLIYTLIPFVLLIPLTFIKKVSWLGVPSLIADALLIVGMAILYQSFHCDHYSETNYIEITTYPLFLGILTASYEGIGLVVPVQQTMNYNKWRYPLLLDIVLIIVTLLLGSFGVTGYLTHAGLTEQVITQNLAKCEPLTYIVQICLWFAIYFTLPMQMFPVSEIFDKLVAKDSDRNPEGHLPYFVMVPNLVRIAILCFVFLVAYFVPFFGLIGGLVGAFGSSILAFILPVVFHFLVFKDELPWYIKAKDVLICLFGITSCILGTTLAIKEIVDAIRDEIDPHHDSSSHHSNSTMIMMQF